MDSPSTRADLTPVPTWLGRLAAGEAVVSMFTRIRGASNEKAKRELGWRPTYPSWREGFAKGFAERSVDLDAAGTLLDSPMVTAEPRREQR